MVLSVNLLHAIRTAKSDSGQPDILTQASEGTSIYNHMFTRAYTSIPGKAHMCLMLLVASVKSNYQVTID
jgi:hypothetical protein